MVKNTRNTRTEIGGKGTSTEITIGGRLFAVQVVPNLGGYPGFALDAAIVIEDTGSAELNHAVAAAIARSVSAEHGSAT